MVIKRLSTFKVGKRRLEVTHMVVFYGSGYVKLCLGRTGIIDHLRGCSYIGKMYLHLTLVELSLAVGEHNGTAYTLLGVENLDEAVEGLIVVGNSSSKSLCSKE